MKPYLLVSFFLVTQLHAGWEVIWCEAVQACINKDYAKAEEKFTETIKELEATGDKTHPHVYVDRARLYCLIHKDKQALPDLNIALDNPLLVGDDKLRAVVTRINLYYRLGMFEKGDEDIKEFKKFTNLPKPEIYKDIVIMRNLPDCECAHVIIKAYLLSLYCENESDITISNGICIAKRTKKCCDSNGKCLPKF